MNTWFGIGNLTSDPEIRYTESGKAVASFSIAINNGKDRDGDERPPTYIDVVAWERLAETVGEYLSKGKKCAVLGQITIEDYTDREGVKRRKYRIRANSVEFLSPRNEDDDDRPRRSSSNRSSSRRAPDDNLDDLPF